VLADVHFSTTALAGRWDNITAEPNCNASCDGNFQTFVKVFTVFSPALLDGI
jgi:hypothetical protein